MGNKFPTLGLVYSNSEVEIGNCSHLKLGGKAILGKIVSPALQQVKCFATFLFIGLGSHAGTCFYDMMFLLQLT